MKILLADDSLAMRAVFRKVLEKLGHATADILEAREGREVLRVLQNPNQPIDLIIFDWDLPGLDGLGLMGHLKSLGAGERVFVLLSVGRQQRALVSQAARLGRCDSIDRPFTEEVLEAKLRSLGRSPAGKKSESTKGAGVAPPGPQAPQASTSMPFLVRLHSTVIDDLLKLADERRHEAGTVLLKTGQVSDALHIVTRGQVEIVSGAKTLRVVREGDPFGEFSFMMSEPSTYTARAKTTVITASLSKARISDLLLRHPDLDAAISSLLGRHKATMTHRATTIIQSDFKGTFDTMPFANVLQILGVGRKSGVLGIRQDEHSGGIYLVEGEAVHAWTDDLKGEPAFYALSCWTKAKFAFNSVRREEERTLHKPMMTLLMEAMRSLEEKASSSAGLEELFPPS